MKKQGRFSTKMIILIPVFILGFVSVISSILAVRNIRKVNANATQIANGYMVCVDELGDIQSETEKIHRLGLSHIVATDLDTMISLVDTIRSEQAVLDDYLAAFEQYVDDSDQDNYEAILSNYEGLKYEIANLMAYSANGDKEAAYALRTYRHKAYFSLDYDANVERDALVIVLTPADIFEQKEENAKLYKALDSLPEKQRNRISSHFLLGMSLSEIAKSEGSAVSSVYEGIQRGLRRLNKILKKMEADPENNPQK